MKNYDMSVLYHPAKANIVVYSLSRLSMGSVSNVEDGNKKLVEEVHQLARLGVHLLDLIEGSVWVHNSLKSSLVFKEKEKLDRDSSLVKLKESVRD